MQQWAMDITQITSKLKNECLIVRIKMIHREISSIYDNAYRDISIKSSQATVLITIAYLKISSPVDLGKRLSLERSSVSRILDKLHSAGWIELELSQKGRIDKVKLSNEGEQKVKDIYPRWKKAQVKARKHLKESRIFEEVGL